MVDTKLTQTEIEGSAFGLGGKWKKIDDEIPTVLEKDQTVIIKKKCKKEKTIRIYAIFTNEHGPQMEQLKVIPDE